MKKPLLVSLPLIGLASMVSAATPEIAPPLSDASRIATVTITNPSPFERPDEVVRLAFSELGPGASESNRDAIVALRNGHTIPFQAVDEDGDGTSDVLAVVVDLDVEESVEIAIVEDAATAQAHAFPKRTQAEISKKVGGSWSDGIYEGGEFVNVTSVTFDGQLKDHNFFMRYEGPGWESDKVGYRIYLDHRNGIDVFGKKIPAMVLQNVGQDGYDSYHEPAFWGLDILKVGEALGLGSFGAWSDGAAHRVAGTERTHSRIVENGAVTSSFKTDYEGWEHPGGEADLTSLLSIDAGSYLTHATLTVAGDVPEMVTGIPQHPNATWIRGETDIPNEAWTYLAAFGQQSLAGDNLGLAIFMQNESFGGFAEDAHNQLVRLELEENSVSYYFGAVWEGSTPAGATEEAFREWLDATVKRLNRTPRVSIDTPAMAAKLESTPPVENSIEWTRALADSVLGRRGDSLAHGSYDPESSAPARWRYTTGLLTFALDRLGEYLDEPAYSRFAAETIGSYVDEDGGIATYDRTEYNVDKINSGKMVLRLFEETGEERYRLAAENLLQQLEEHPRTSEGAFWHKKIYPHQIWLDGVYMAIPFLAKAGVLFDHPEWLHESVNEFLIVEKHLRDPETGLYFHGWDESREQDWADPETGLSDEMWGRGLGWYSMALVDTLDILDPESSDAAELRRLLEDLAEALVAAQDEETGVWYQVLNKPDATGNFPEASGSAMFTYTLARGVNQGYLPEEYADAAKRAYAGLIETFMIVEADGSLSLTGICQVAGLGYGRDGSYAYYMGTPIVKNDAKGVGPTVLAGIEIDRMTQSR